MAIQRDREGHVEDIGHHRAEAGLVGLDLAGQRHAHEGAAVEATAKGDDGITAGMGAGDLDRVFNGFGTGGDEGRALVEVTRNQRVQALAKGDVVFVRQDLVAGMGEGFELGLDRFHDLRVAMAGVHHGDACGEVDIAGAFDIPDLGVAGLGRIDLGLHANATGDGGLAAGGDFGVKHVMPPERSGALNLARLSSQMPCSKWFLQSNSF